MILPQGEYTLNGCPSGGSNTTYMLNITNISTQDIGSGANFTSDGTTSLNIRIIVRANTTASNLLFKPMIRLASVTDATFAPYSNICPISGWTEANVTVSPLNISQLYNGQIYGDGTRVSSNMRLTNVTETQDNSYFLKAGTYTLDYDKLNSNAPNLLQCSALTKDDNYTIIDNFANEWNSVPFTFTLTQDGYLYFTIRKDADTNINPSDYRAKILGHTTTIPFQDAQGNPVEVFGGELDVVNGTVKPNIEYDSYNGETLVGRWISDRDVYAEGTTPTIGAQVVDLGAYGSDISAQPTSIKSIEGVNNVWGDTGEIIKLEYLANATDVIASLDARITALENA